MESVTAPVGRTMDFVFTTDIARANLPAAESGVTDAVFAWRRAERVA